MKQGAFYLAGPMRLIKDNIKWRDVATTYLSKLAFDVLLPTHRGNCTNSEIVNQDLRDIQIATGVLAWIPDSIVAIGTAMEIFYAANVLQHPVVVWGERYSISPWLTQHCVGITTTLSEALTFITENRELFIEVDTIRNK